MTKLIAALALNLTMFMCVHAAFAQGSEGQTSADQYYFAKDYVHAVDAYRAVLASSPTNAQAWYRLGVSLQSLGKFDEAVTDYDQALKNGFQPFSVYYRLATLELQRNDKKAAVADLAKAVAAGTIKPEDLTTDDNLKSLADYPPFVALIDAQSRSFYPCMYDNRYRAMDFWIGDWNVQTQDGRSQLGTSHIELGLAKCVIMENWTASSGGTGKSFTFFDQQSGKWVQHWVDGFGSSTDYYGNVSGSSVVFVAHRKNAKGAPMVTRMTFTPLVDGRVRQLFELSSDDGRTWKPTFDGYYAKAKPVRGE